MAGAGKESRVTTTAPATQTKTKFTKAKIMVWILVAGLALAVLMVLSVVLTVDDWSRDLTTNHAATAANHPDTRLRPLTCKQTPRELADAVRRAAGAGARWNVVDEKADGDHITLHLTHATRLFRFIDDIVVRISPTESGSELSAESQSRVGKGDLGQNPRNLRELLDRVRAELP